MGPRPGPGLEHAMAYRVRDGGLLAAVHAPTGGLTTLCGAIFAGQAYRQTARSAEWLPSVWEVAGVRLERRLRGRWRLRTGAACRHFTARQFGTAACRIFPLRGRLIEGRGRYILKRRLLIASGVCRARGHRQSVRTL